VTYTLLHEGDPSIESVQGVFFKMRRALGTTRQVKGGSQGLRFIVVGAQPKSLYDGCESL
jgi:hypothetical protein